MSATLIEKARANRVAALEHIDERKSKLISLSDFRDAAKQKSTTVVGFVSSRAAMEDAKIAA